MENWTEEDDRLFALQLQEYERSGGFNCLDSEKQCDQDRELALSLSKEDKGSNYENNAQDDYDDYILALSLDQELNQSNQIPEDDDDDCFKVNGKIYKSLVDPVLDIVDPSPDIWHIFRQFDKRFFRSTLVKHGVQLNWSNRMTSCAGLCSWNPYNHLCNIRLSAPLLKLRPRSDLVETLLHEMIHALLFVTKECDNHESHGPKFHEHMSRINKETGANITVYHTFHAEVRHYQKHVWRCDGTCRNKAPFYGYVHRAMNRKPGPSDWWFADHQRTCGGMFVKISEHPAKEKVNSGTKQPTTPSIKNFFKPVKVSNAVPVSLPSTSKDAPKRKDFTPFMGKGFTLGSGPKLSNNTVPTCTASFMNKVAQSDPHPKNTSMSKNAVKSHKKTKTEPKISKDASIEVIDID